MKTAKRTYLSTVLSIAQGDVLYTHTRRSLFQTKLKPVKFLSLLRTNDIVTSLRKDLVV